MKRLLTVLVLLAVAACGRDADENGPFDCAAYLATLDGSMTTWNLDEGSDEARALLAKYTPFRLTTDLSVLTENECRMLPLLMEAGEAMNAVVLRDSPCRFNDLPYRVDRVVRIRRPGGDELDRLTQRHFRLAHDRSPGRRRLRCGCGDGPVRDERLQ